MKFSWTGLFYHCSQVNASTSSEIEFQQQASIYNRYTQLIELEEKELKEFRSSKINLRDIEERRKSKTGSEDILAIDLGGSSIKIAIIGVTFNDKDVSFEKKEYVNYKYSEVPGLKTCTWNDWTARKVAEFLKGKQSSISKAAFTFSFKMNQESLIKAECEGVNKDWWFHEENKHSKDVVGDLNKSLKSLGLTIKANCVLNDVIATFMTGVARGMNNPIGIIIGTGINAGFPISVNGEKVVINSELASFPVPEVDEPCVNEEGLLKLEVLTAGLRLENILRQRLMKLCTRDVNRLGIAEMYTMAGSTSKQNTFESTVKRELLAQRTRAHRILAPLIAAISKDAESFSVIANGSVIQNSIDQDLMNKEILTFLTILKGKMSNFEIEFKADASLFGSVYVSSLYDE